MKRVRAIERLADLREPPVVGRSYRVPFVRAWWNGKEADWPVLGPAHTDLEFFNFKYRHYHVDARFVSRRMLRGSICPGEDIVILTQRYPLSGKSESRHGPDGIEYGPGPDALPRGRPAERAFRCMRVELPYHFASQPQVQQLRAKHGGGACAPVVLSDGRRLCPHRKVDLSNMVPAPDGTVTCPLHGLRVQMIDVSA